MRRSLGQNRIRRGLLESRPLTEKTSKASDDPSGPPHINPTLRAWLDNVIVPSLVRGYLKREQHHQTQKPTLARNEDRVYARHDLEQE
jgi:hypothetical protein